MKFLLLSALLAVALSHSLGYPESDITEWELFKVTHEKEYVSEEEERERRDIFMSNLNFIREHNKRYENGEVTFNCAMNGFGDMTQEEVKATMMGYNRPAGLPRSGMPFTGTFDASLPSKVDWRTKGAVTPIKNQGSYCGSCWAFSSTGSLEGQHFLKTKKLVSLSEQNLVDCSKNGGNEGCKGGTMDAAFTYIKTNKGIDTEKSYPYKAQDGKCHYKAKNRGATDSGHVDITEDDEDELQTAVANVGPISVAMDANHTSFTYYSSGVYSEPACSSTKLDHGVLAIGYGTVGGKKYWLVKNSWGTDWGMKGYFMIARDDNNMCGIATMASYPTV